MTFDELYRQYYELIYKFCFRFLKSREKARDVTQDTFLKLFEQMNKGEYQIENPKAWLYKVVANKSLNIINTTNRQREIEQELEFVSSSSSNPESQLISRENRLQIKKAISVLKPEHQLYGIYVPGWLVIQRNGRCNQHPF